MVKSHRERAATPAPPEPHEVAKLLVAGSRIRFHKRREGEEDFLPFPVRLNCVALALLDRSLEGYVGRHRPIIVSAGHIRTLTREIGNGQAEQITRPPQAVMIELLTPVSETRNHDHRRVWRLRSNLVDLDALDRRINSHHVGRQLPISTRTRNYRDEYDWQHIPDQSHSNIQLLVFRTGLLEKTHSTQILL